MKRLLLLILLFSVFARPGLAAPQTKHQVKQGNRLYQKGEFSQALKSYEQALADVPDSDIVNFNLGAALYKTKDYEQAAEHFEKSLVSENQSLEQKASYNIGNSKYKYGIGYEDTDLLKAVDLLKQSLRHYQRALELDPEDEDAQYNYDFVKKELQRLQEKLQQQKQQSGAQQQSQDSGDKKEKQQEQEQKEQQTESQKEQSEKEQSEPESQEQLQPEQPQGGKERQEQAEAQRPQPQQPEEGEDEQTGQSTQSAEELSKQEALMLLEGYQQEDEPKGLYRQKLSPSSLPEVLQDW